MRVRILAAVMSASLCSLGLAHAETSIGVTAQFDRKPHDFGDPQGTKYPIEVAHIFPSSVMIGGSFEPQLKTGSDDPTCNLEGYVGYKLELNEVVSFGVTGGLGQRFADSSDDFPYYVFHVRADVALDEHWTINVVNYRYRNAFDTEDDYNTPEVATGISLKIDDKNTISAKYYYSWKEGEPEDQGIGIGYRFGF